MPHTDTDTDLLIIGAGPTGLFAAYYAGFRGLRVAVVDSLPELGGQITAMYPEKAILDVAGFPSVKGKELVEGLVAQAASAKPTYHLDRTARTLQHHGDAQPAEAGVVGGVEAGGAGADDQEVGVDHVAIQPLPTDAAN